MVHCIFVRDVPDIEFHFKILSKSDLARFASINLDEAGIGSKLHLIYRSFFSVLCDFFSKTLCQIGPAFM